LLVEQGAFVLMFVPHSTKDRARMETDPENISFEASIKAYISVTS
jgi:hypothetical protein